MSTEAQGKIDYEIPAADQQAKWQELVVKAVQDKTLNWTHDVGTTWVISGTCPRCHDKGLSNVIDLDVVTGYQVAELMPGVGKTTSKVTVEVVCTCDKVHLKDRVGCGWGKGLQIAVDNPIPSANRTVLRGGT